MGNGMLKTEKWLQELVSIKEDWRVAQHTFITFYLQMSQRTEKCMYTHKEQLLVTWKNYLDKILFHNVNWGFKPSTG